ncbi:MAG TPA: hypothetical protein VFI90_03080 [Rubrobacter sp.]|nr:hypothetical protein [Rubrobacter sp.]
MAHYSRIRWYNPKLEEYEWRDVPKSDEVALSLLEGSPHSPICTQIYLEWRALDAPITAALIRVGEAAEHEGDGEKEGDAR